MPNTAASVQQYWADQLELMATLPAQVRARQPESIHDLRAAGRRLKSTIRTYRPLIRRRLARELLASLDWYNAVLGDARDAEVIDLELAELLGERPGAREIIAALDAERGRTAHIADNMLTSARADEVLALVQELVDDPWRRTGRKRDKRSARGSIQRRVRWAERRVAREWRRGPQRGEGTDAWLHRLRRRSKSARYAFESVASVSPEAKSVADAHARVATLLGIVQDTVVIERALAIWPDLLVADVIATRQEMSERALGELPEAIQKAVPADMIGPRAKATLD